MAGEMMEEARQLRAENAQVRAAFLYQIQSANRCGKFRAPDGRPCHSHQCGCALEMQSYIDERAALDNEQRGNADGNRG